MYASVIIVVIIIVIINSNLFGESSSQRTEDIRLQREEPSVCPPQKKTGAK